MEGKQGRLGGERSVCRDIYISAPGIRCSRKNNISSLLHEADEGRKAEQQRHRSNRTASRRCPDQNHPDKYPNRVALEAHAAHR